MKKKITFNINALNNKKSDRQITKISIKTYKTKTVKNLRINPIRKSNRF